MNAHENSIVVSVRASDSFIEVHEFISVPHQHAIHFILQLIPNEPNHHQSSIFFLLTCSRASRATISAAVSSIQNHCRKTLWTGPMAPNIAMKTHLVLSIPKGHGGAGAETAVHKKRGCRKLPNKPEVRSR